MPRGPPGRVRRPRRRFPSTTWLCPPATRRSNDVQATVAAERDCPERTFMETSTARAIHDPAAQFYMEALQKLQDTGIPFLIGGALAFSHYSNIPRDTKDLDVFVRSPDCQRVLEAFASAGYQTEMTFPHWLGKVRRGAHFMDVIFS